MNLIQLTLALALLVSVVLSSPISRGKCELKNILLQKLIIFV